MPNLYAALFDATLVLSGLKISVSTPKFPITSFTRQASESLDAGWCGFPKVMKNSIVFGDNFRPFCQVCINTFNWTK